MTGRRLIFQLGTNNWQRGGEFAPGSGILHESHHHAYNSLPGTKSYSMYPSRTQRFEQEDVRIFELDHDIPICESISPASNYRWHAMSDGDVAAYRARLTSEVSRWMAEIEERTGECFRLAIAHHTFLNPVVLRDVIHKRTAEGRPRMPLLCFAHGTALKMYANERRGDQPDEFPLRFLPMIEGERIFSYGDRAGSVDLAAAISREQIDALVDIFPSFPRERVVLSPNGYNQSIFRPPEPANDTLAGRMDLLKAFETCPFDGSPHAARPVEGEFDGIVIFCGKFADWKRLDALLHAASIYERTASRIATLIVGSGPHDDQVRMQTLALDQLGLKHTFFLGPRGQDELATLFGAADVGCFPSKNEPFGLVFIECMASGTPVIGANSGGPRDFVTSDVGMLVAETDDTEAMAVSLAEAIRSAIIEGWKAKKGPTAAARARRDFSVVAQVQGLLDAVDRI
ncbi:MAG: glycosyltransferase family 4 protein [Alphaproteobacteria bacterium]|nr:glycosyltransferase family 4 protein [Alphaproteobacteria bacterium]